MPLGKKEQPGYHESLLSETGYWPKPSSQCLPFSQTQDSSWDTFSSPIPKVMGGRGLLHSRSHLPELS